MDEQGWRDALHALALQDPGKQGWPDSSGTGAYGLTWPGKAAMLAALARPAGAVLKPWPEAGLNAVRTPHAVIEGDNLPVLKRLRKRYRGRIKMIYIDPPYNTGGDFLYADNFRVPRGGDAATDGGEEGRRHGRWLNMIYPRLALARELLREDGVLFVSIDDNEVHTLRLVLDEIFGSANFVAMFPWQSRTSRQNDTDLCVQHEYVVAYARRRRHAQRRLTAANETLWRTLPGFAAWPLAVRAGRYSNPDNDPRGPWKADPFDAPNVRPALTYPITNPATGQVFQPPPGRCWRTGPERCAELQAQGRILFGRRGRARPQLKVFLDEKKAYGEVATTWLDGATFGTARGGTQELQALFGARVPFTYPKPTALLRFLLRLATGPGDLVMDFFAGSGTTGHAVLAENLADGGGRRFLLVQRAEATGEPRWPTIADITRERLRRAARELGSEEGFRAWRLVTPDRAGSRSGTPPR
ncbi:MAG TPA: site-specific DNA-methyltransferase [Alcanivorax sp.]|nr:site-specific DNA-methyltransferase [Alcanivorax sp.]